MIAELVTLVAELLSMMSMGGAGRGGWGPGKGAGVIGIHEDVNSSRRLCCVDAGVCVLVVRLFCVRNRKTIVCKGGWLGSLFVFVRLFVERS